MQNHSENTGDAGADPTEQFVALMATHQRELYRFIFTLLPNEADADDVLQQTSVVMWRKFSEFTPGTDFFRWGAKIAHYKVLDFRKSQSRQRLHFWTEELVDAIASTRVEQSDHLADRRHALAICLEKLNFRDRQLVEHRYRSQTTIKILAEELSRPVDTLYKALNRIHRTLFSCIERTLARLERE